MSSKSAKAKQLGDKILTAYRAGAAQAFNQDDLGGDTATVSNNNNNNNKNNNNNNNNYNNRSNKNNTYNKLTTTTSKTSHLLMTLF